MKKSIVTSNTIVINEDMKFNGETVLTYKIGYPEFESSHYQISLASINKFYKDKALEYQNYCRNELFEMAVEQYKYDIENDFPVHVYEALVVYKLTYNIDCIISLYFDQYEYTGGAHGNTLRYSQTWNLQNCIQIGLSQLFSCSLDYKVYILRQVEEQIKKDTGMYFENYEQLILEAFNENSFYYTPEGIVLYYQQYDIAPYSSGIREFLIPYTNCILNPVFLCMFK